MGADHGYRTERSHHHHVNISDVVKKTREEMYGVFLSKIVLLVAIRCQQRRAGRQEVRRKHEKDNNGS